MKTVSFIVPAYNEEELLPDTLKAIHDAAASLGLEYEIIVADDGSDDATQSIAVDLGARVVSHKHRQIAATRNSGAAHATGDFLFFVDADTIVTADAVKRALSAMQSGAVGGGARVKFQGPIPIWARLSIVPLVRVYLFFDLAPGCFLFATKPAFEQVGGFNSQLFAGEETDLSLRLRKLGRFVVVNATVSTSGRKVQDHSLWEILRPAKLLMQGKNGLTNRDRLEMWYSPKRSRVD